MLREVALPPSIGKFKECSCVNDGADSTKAAELAVPVGKNNRA